MATKQKRNLVETGMDEAAAFKALLDSDNWLPTRSDGGENGGWFRMVHKRSDTNLYVEDDATRTVTRILVG